MANTRRPASFGGYLPPQASDEYIAGRLETNALVVVSNSSSMVMWRLVLDTMDGNALKMQYSEDAGVTFTTKGILDPQNDGSLVAAEVKTKALNLTDNLGGIGEVVLGEMI